MDALTWHAVQKGLATWRAKPHNEKWWRQIDGTPIPNDLCVCIAEAVADARPFMPPTQWAYDQACKALDHWRAEAKRLRAALEEIAELEDVRSDEAGSVAGRALKIKSEMT